MAGSISSSDSSLSLNTILRMITVKLSSTNYLLWRNQLLTLLAYQKLSGHINCTVAAPSKTTAPNAADSSSPNPAYTSWLEDDQKAF